MEESGRAYLNSKNLFVNGIWELVNYFKGDTVVANPLSKLIGVLTEIGRYQSILVDEAQQSTVKNLSDFIKNDIQQVKDCKRIFEKISDEYDNALFRHSQVPKTRPHEIEEIGNLLKATRSCFQHAALDYTAQVSILQTKKRFEALDTLLSMLHMYTTYFHQGWDLIQDYDPFLKQVTATLTKLKEESTSLEKKMEGRHSLITQTDVIPVLVRNLLSKNIIRMEGFLFKRTSNAFKTWNRRWFIIQNRQLVYRKRTKDDLITVMEEDLRLCSVKLATEVDRRFCFEVQSPSKSHMLQADSEEACQQWVRALQAGISDALNNTMQEDNRNEEPELLKYQVIQRLQVQKVTKNGQVPPAKPPRVYNRILSIPGNDLCCDCRSPDPHWASINLGITLCIECSGIHRSLGVHMSKVRSITLDVWEPELLKVMGELGNTFVNSIYEAHVNENIAVRATPDCLRNVRETWIRAKYVKKAFVQSFPFSVPANNEEKMGRGMPRRWSVRKQNRRRRSLKLRSENKAQDLRFSEAVDFRDKKEHFFDTHGHVKRLRSSEEATLEFKEFIPNQEKHLCDIYEKKENTLNSDELPSIAIDKESGIESDMKESSPNNDKQSSSSFKIEANSEEHSNTEIGKEDHRTNTKKQSSAERDAEEPKTSNEEQSSTEIDEEESKASNEKQSSTERDEEEPKASNEEQLNTERYEEESKVSNEEQSSTERDEEESKVSNEEQSSTERDDEESKASNEKQSSTERDEEEPKASNEVQSSIEVIEIDNKANIKKETDIMSEIKEGNPISEEQSNAKKIEEKVNSEGQPSINIDKKEEINQYEEQSLIKCDNKENKSNNEEKSPINNDNEKEKDKMNNWEQSNIEDKQKTVKSSTGEITGSEKYKFEDSPSLMDIEKEFSSKDQDIFVFGVIIEQDIPGSTGVEMDSADETPSPNDDDDDDTTQEDDMSKLNPSLLLYRAAAAHNIPVMCQAQAYGGDLNWSNDEDRGMLPLHQAIMSGSIMACEYLLLNGAKVNNQDEERKTALHLATELGHTGQVCQLLKRGADQHIVDSAGYNALDIAVTNANADIVTLLRLAKLNEEVQKDEFGNSVSVIW
ncbi:arf-GAP with coiled-coil, ANK repeat and PH domain-containing protein 2-like isoform X2 [Limulus polyphemus]|uniref:Arf-GAP with coiled-coil, ANK repeat and PH domain-containing protein 2-like isoform X2 n=1 Tax=Limulus polyphemus TaxID=6850 RepID=A0ABM1TDA1_LIMPO|nr:arf-GAP with coiled-coil, ANK repeat and PH domain-containing protein 2-like isoform X2 [Limulus polyphemus]